MTLRPADQILRQTLLIDWSRLEPAAALRCMAGVAIPLIAGLAIGQPWVSAFGAIGAVSVGFGSFQGAYRSRAATMIVASAGMGGAIFAGTLAANDTLTSVGLAAGAAFLSGYLVSVGQAASFVALQCGVAVITAGAFPAPSGVAALRGLLVLLGGLAQTLLVVGVWPMRRFSAERASVASVYSSLAGYARRIAEGSVTAPEPHTLATVASPFIDPHPFARRVDVLVFQALLDEAERIRASLAALAVRREPLAAAHDACANQLTTAIGAVLDDIARALAEAREPADRADTWRAIDGCAGALPQTPAIDALLGQLRAAWRTAGVPAAEPSSRGGGRLPPLRYGPPVRDALTTLRANLTLDSAAFRHAVRLAAAVSIAMIVYRTLHQLRGYWMPMTALLVLRPEFSETFSRGLARIGGTLVGAAAAAGIVHLLHPSPDLLAAFVLVAVYGCYALFRASYALFTICLTGYVVFILMLSGVGEMTAASARAIYTIEGGALALVVYSVWPTWAGRTARSSFAAMLDAQNAYVQALLAAFVEPARVDLARLGRIRADARLQRSNTEALIERMSAEPAARAAFDRGRAFGLLAALRRHALAALALHAALEGGSGHAVPAAAPLAADMGDAFARLAEAVRSGAVPAPLPPLRRRHGAVAADPVIGPETDLMVDSLNTMAELLGARSSVAEAAANPGIEH